MNDHLKVSHSLMQKGLMVKKRKFAVSSISSINARQKKSYDSPKKNDCRANSGHRQNAHGEDSQPATFCHGLCDRRTYRSRLFAELNHVKNIKL